jgi:hypothetical protein
LHRLRESACPHHAYDCIGQAASELSDHVSDVEASYEGTFHERCLSESYTSTCVVVGMRTRTVMAIARLMKLYMNASIRFVIWKLTLYPELHLYLSMALFLTRIACRPPSRAGDRMLQDTHLSARVKTAFMYLKHATINPNFPSTRRDKTRQMLLRFSSRFCTYPP